VNTLLQDVRYGLRMLAKSPGFTAVAAITLGLGIGANTAMFSVLYGLVLRPLPYANSSRLVMLWDSNHKTGQKHITVMEGSFPILRSQAKSFEDMAAFHSNPLDNLVATKLWGTEERVATTFVSPQLFSILEVPPLLGRTFTASEGIAIVSGDEQEAAHVAVLSYAFWRRHYGANPDVIGQTIALNEFGEKKQFTIVGVMPKEFDFPYPLEPDEPDFWTNYSTTTGVFYPGSDLRVKGFCHDPKPGTPSHSFSSKFSRVERDFSDTLLGRLPHVLVRIERLDVFPIRTLL
jgi:putative ABC transport system permease protein